MPTTTELETLQAEVADLKARIDSGILMSADEMEVVALKMCLPKPR